MTEVTKITPASPMGGDYPFLKRLDVDWQLDSIPLDEQLRGAMFDSTQSFGYVRAEGYTRLRVPGREANRMGQFARDQLRLRLDPARKGIYTLSKRISRINRPYRMYSFFRAEEMVIHVDPTLDRQTWDGAGRISRGFLRTMLERVPADYRQWATHEVERTRRWEFTVMTQRGQYKGHCLVIDDQFEDLVLPDDCKTELGLIDPEVFIGLVPVHSADHMRLDTQSLINLYPFFDVNTLMGWLREASAVVLDDMASGRADRAFALMAVDDDSPWHVPAFIQSGGNPRWFAGILRGMTSGYLNSLRKSAVEGLRLPIPGGRYYVAVDVVGGYEVPSGHIKLDPRHGTAWVNHDDWHRMLAARWGGADQDDPLWCMPFTDYDGSRKVLAWRSPNQAGEYALLTPTNDSHEIVWHTVDGEYCWPELDSRRLPSPIETMGTRYLNLVDEDDVLPAPDRYGLVALRPAVERAFENDAVLGTYCNRLMLTTALSNIETETLPCRLETIIDAQVKTGAPLGVVMMDCEQWAVGFAARNPIPKALAARIASSVGEHITLSQDHWLDQLVCDIETHIDDVTAASEVMASQSLPPVEVLQAGMSHIREGAKLRSIYGRAFSRTDQRTRTQYEQARRDTESYLHSFSLETQSRVLLGAVVQAYLAAWSCPIRSWT